MGLFPPCSFIKLVSISNFLLHVAVLIFCAVSSPLSGHPPDDGSPRLSLILPQKQQNGDFWELRRPIRREPNLTLPNISSFLLYLVLFLEGLQFFFVCGTNTSRVHCTSYLAQDEKLSTCVSQNQGTDKFWGLCMYLAMLFDLTGRKDF